MLAVTTVLKHLSGVLPGTGTTPAGAGPGGEGRDKAMAAAIAVSMTLARRGPGDAGQASAVETPRGDEAERSGSDQQDASA